MLGWLLASGRGAGHRAGDAGGYPGNAHRGALPRLLFSVTQRRACVLVVVVPVPGPVTGISLILALTRIYPTSIGQVTG